MYGEILEQTIRLFWIVRLVVEDALIPKTHFPVLSKFSTSLSLIEISVPEDRSIPYTKLVDLKSRISFF